MLFAELLIDKAIDSCGSAAELARRMGIDRAEITKLRQGKRPLSPEIAAELADLAGDDAREAAIHAMIDRNAGSRKGHLLREILGKGIAAGVVGLLVFFYSGDSISATGQSQMIAKNDLTIYDSIHRIYSVMRVWLRRVFKRCLGDCTDVHRALAFG